MNESRRNFLRGALAALAAVATPLKYKLLEEEEWSTTEEAGSIDLPSEITGMVSQGPYLFVQCIDGLYVITGESAFDFKVHKVATA